uniref:NADH-ubiquinone oxidoreductase chain 3 n=1 Tax=Strongyloides sp. EN-2020c TaxID=2725241 RepID=A0A6J4CTT7_9BILA|nr:NADH dehydrogenase subunit 3 [Strongyloides sp. EN-2020c]
MFVLFLVFFFAFFFSLFFYFFSLFFSFINFYNSKSSSYESGFVSVGLIQNSFSIHFFVIMIMFVVFDLEVILFIGILISDLNSFICFLFLFVFLFLFFYMEWFYGKLVWNF